MGRPVLPRGKAHTADLKIRLRPETAAAIRALAQARGVSVSAAVREGLILWVRANS